MVFGFGNNEHGQLALGDRAPRTTPAFCDYFHDEGIFVDKIAVGGNHNLASSNVTGLWTWGWNDFSQLGHKGADNHDSTDIPQSLFELEGKKILSIAAGYMHSVCLVLNWRLRDSMVIDDYELKKKARRAEDNKEIVKIDSEFLGNGNKKQRFLAKKKEKKQAAMAKQAAEHKQKLIASYENAETPTVYTWGEGSKGQLGHGATYTVEAFKKVAGTKAASMQAKERQYTQLGKARKIISLLPPPGQKEHIFGTVTKVVAKGCNTACLTSKGILLTFGDNSYGQLGRGQITAYGSGDPDGVFEGWAVTTSIPEKIIDIAISYYSALARSNNGFVYTWGRGDQGCLGYGKDEKGKHQRQCQPMPRVCEKVSNRGVFSIAAGDQHMMARTELGQLYIWGMTGSGRLGLEGGSSNEFDDDEGTCQDVPIIHPYFERERIQIGDMAAGGAHTVVVTQMFPADDVAGKPKFSSEMLEPQEEEESWMDMNFCNCQ